MWVKVCVHVCLVYVDVYAGEVLLQAFRNDEKNYLKGQPQLANNVAASRCNA